MENDIMCAVDSKKIERVKHTLQPMVRRVEFWAEHTGNYWLSNFYPAKIVLDGSEYATSEHLYQALKCASHRKHDKVRREPTPKAAKALAKQLGRNLGVPEKAFLMRSAIREKFKQHPDLREKLMNCEGMIVEASPFDCLWGEGPRKHGLNLMGLLLMELREELLANK